MFDHAQSIIGDLSLKKLADALKNDENDINFFIKQTKIVSFFCLFILSIFGFFGYSKYVEIEDTFKKKIEDISKKNIELLHHTVSGTMRVNNSDWNAAIAHFEQANLLQPGDEYISNGLLSAYASAGETEAGLKFISEIEKNGLLQKKHSSAYLNLNVGRTYLVVSIKHSNYINKSKYFLELAQRHSLIKNQYELQYIYYSLSIAEYMSGNMAKFLEYAKLCVEIFPKSATWPDEDMQDPWFRLLISNYPNFSTDFKNATQKK